MVIGSGKSCSAFLSVLLGIVVPARSREGEAWDKHLFPLGHPIS